MSNIRKNGLTKPYAPLQMVTWVIWPLLVIQFLFFVSPVLPIAASIPCTVVYIFFALASAYYSYYCTITDPMDPLLKRHLAEQKAHDEGGTCTLDEGTHTRHGFLFTFFQPRKIHKTSHEEETAPEDQDGTTDVDDTDTKHCWVCETQVHVHAMHCKYCDKCVSHFDHHCQWLNNCVGEANYPYFYATLWSITFMLLIHLVLMIAVVVDNFVATSKRGDDWFNADLFELVVTVNLIFCVLTSIALSLVLQLLWFHLGLRKEGLTTYQFIVRDSAKKREQSRFEAAEQSRRLVAIANAKQKKDTCLAWRLGVGEHMKCCDPLEPEDIPEDDEKKASESTV
jgi:hypothetical protein